MSKSIGTIGVSPVKTRMFWTWDHSTEWALNCPGAQTTGASNCYARTNDAFIEDYTKLLVWCGRHHIDAVVIWGLLRDCHGGVESAKKLCDVAQENGVRVLCGVGLNAYGGVYYDGSSPHSLTQHLADHPELTGVDSGGNACPSRKENQDFTVESLQWLFKTLPSLGGVQIETGDTGVCHCKLCQQRRQHPSSVFSWEDMSLMYPLAAEAVRSVAKDAWIVCETYSHPEPHTDPEHVPEFGQGKPPWADGCLAKFPEDVFVQWTCDHYVKPWSKRKWTKAGVVKDERRHHIMRAHFSTYWAGLRGELAVDWIAKMYQKSMVSGFDAISIFGEVSPFDTGAELNYLAHEHYGSADNLGADLDMFLTDVAGPLLGGEENAREYLSYARLVTSHRRRIPEALPKIYAKCVELPPAIAQRWIWLANFLASFVYG